MIHPMRSALAKKENPKRSEFTELNAFGK
jgi:hypothetical protein